MLDIKNLTSGYKDSKIIRDVSLKVPDEEIVALMGSNGVGKTTFLKSIMGLISTTSGSISFDGKDITNWSSEQRAKLGIAYVPQGRFIFPYLTVEKNLLVGVDNPRKTAVKEKQEEIYSLFPKLKTIAKRQGGDLSGGEQQQLAIGRVLMMNPKILILDEPTEGIQPSIIQEISHILNHICTEHKTAILLVEQHIHFALEYAHSYYVFGRGTVIQQGSVTKENREQVADKIEI